jgi:hypothetical protein
MLERARVRLHAGRMHAGLVCERVAPHIRLVGIGRQVADLVDQVRRLGQPGGPLGGHALQAELQLQGRQDREQVCVPAPLAVSVRRSLHQGGTRPDRGQRVGDRALGVVVSVDPDRRPSARARIVDAQRLEGGRGRALDVARQRRPVCVAQGHVLGSSLHRDPKALERVGAVVAPRVEEVLGVVDDPLSLAGEEGNRVPDHRQVLVARHPRHLLEVEGPGLADQRADRGET